MEVGGRVAKKLTAAEIHRLARAGAAAKLTQLEREIAALKRAFPGLKAHSAPVTAPPPEPVPRVGPETTSPRRGRRTPMNAAERKAVSERMKRYWDARRKAGNN
jgi:hypothetical protein